ncbi:MAG: energy-coupling factor transporter transmembrane protein EcfT, partial [Ruminococcaceae bacterium]|nr:energy-coupling factor transporter transmembrane protein EcfT [Oscillospiraceae bacterium]
PRIKIILTILYIVCSFICKNIISYALLLVSAILLVIIGRVPLRIILKGLKGVLFILLFTAVLNVFWTKGDMLLWQWNFIAIYVEGLYAALFIMIRISVLIIGTGMLLTYTTTPIALTNAIEDLLSPLKKLHVPVHSFAMMMTIALRFIPTLSEEAERIMTAQKARGADFSSGGLIQRAKALIPVLIPLFVSAFNRAGDLAIAMECRCYNGGDGRTRMNVRRIKFMDFIPLILIIAFGAGLVVLNIVGIGYTA